MLRCNVHSLVFATVILLLAGVESQVAAGINLEEKPAPQLIAGEVSDVGSSWQTITLPLSYEKMVVVATPAYEDDALPAVVRIRNASDNTFEMRVQNPSGQPLTGYSVQYLVVEAGTYTLAEHGVSLEAGRVNSTLTSHTSSWQGEPVAFANTYNSPVVVGQVMTYNDERWSTFWSHGIAPSIPPGLGVLYVGKHVGEDPSNTRSSEELGYIVFEEGTGQIGGYAYQAIAGEDIVRGMEDSPPYKYDHQMDDEGFAIGTIAAMDGVNGGWAVLWGDDWLKKNEVQLVIDEDQTTDEERVHSTEQVHTVIFNVVQSPPELLSFTPDAGIIGEEVALYGNYFTGATSVQFNGVSAAFTVLSDQEIDAIVPDGATTGTIQVVTAGGVATSEGVFELVKTPQIFSFDPEEGPHGTVVEITGQNFVDVLDVSFGGWSSRSYEVLSDTRITATVPTTSGTGRIRVRNAAGMATTPEVFTIIPTFAFEDIIPSRAEASTSIRITGFGLLDAETVRFAGGVEAEFVIVSDEEIVVTVPNDGLSGPVSLVMDDGTVLEGPIDFALTFAEPLQGLNLCRLTYAGIGQSSVSHPFATAGKACDGITDGSLQGESVSSTESEFEAWWETDLGGHFNISEVAVWNRTDCCQDELNDFYILISDEPFASTSLSKSLSEDGVSSYFIEEVALFESIDVARIGRYVRIQKQGTGSLVISEIEVVSGAGNTSTSNEEPDAAQSLMLMDKAYPSPFSNQAAVGFSLPQTADTYLSVFDVLGREVAVLQDGILPAGAHQKTFRAGDLPNGVYFLRLVSRGQIITRSVVLSR